MVQRDLIRGAAVPDDRQVSAVTVVADREIERDSGMTSNEGLRQSTWDRRGHRGRGSKRFVR